MTTEELSSKLKKMYNEAEIGEQVSMIHMFGIKYALEIEESGAAKKDIAIEAEIGESYGTEINKGVKLSRYVQIKDEHKNRF